MTVYYEADVYDANPDCVRFNACCDAPLVIPSDTRRAVDPSPFRRATAQQPDGFVNGSNGPE